MMHMLLRGLVLAMALLAGQAYADCSGPVGTAGRQIYDSSRHVMAYCNGTNWVSMAGGVSVTVNTSGVSAAGSSGQVQYNNGSGLGADSQFTYSGGLLTVTNISTTNLTASGNITAAAFYGDGSNLTGINTQSDRIVSGSLLAVANSATGYISLTTGTTDWGYLSSGVNYLPKLKTDVLSATTAIQVGSNNLTCATNISGTMRYSAISSTMEYCNGSAWTSMGPSSTQPVAFMVRRSANQTVTVSTYTKVQFDAEVFDTNNNFASSRFTPTVPGKYLVTLSTYCADATTQCNAAIYKNGSPQYGSFAYTGSTAPQATAIIDMNGTTDYLEGYVYNGGGTLLYNGIYTYFTGALLAPQGGGAGGTATPAGSTDDVQFASGGALAADTGNFTYASGLLTAPNISTSNISVSTINGTPVGSLGGSGDRITSGTTSMVAISNTKTISITTNNVVTGYFNSNGVLTLPGISATAGLTSVTSLYASGLVGIGTTQPSASMHVNNGSVRVTGDNPSYAYSPLGADRAELVVSTTPRLLLEDDAFNGTWQLDNYIGGLRFILYNSGTTAVPVVISSSGSMGIGTTNPVATLDVVGSISATTAIQVGSNSLTCGTGISGTMRYSAISSTMEYCNGSAWTSMGPSSTSPVAFSVNKGGTNQTVTTGAIVKLTWGAEIFDTNNNFSSDRFTPTVPGKYLINLNIYCNDSTTGCIAMIYKNGTAVAQVNGAAKFTNVNTILDMNGTTDYVEGYVSNGGGTTINGGAHLTYFTGVMLSPQGGGASGTATPAGSTDDVQFASGGALAADTGNFTYASGLLTAPNISTSNISVSTINGTPVGSLGGSGDRITSGSLVAIANSATGYISLTTGGTNWGYLSSAASYIPNLSSNFVSTTNISATTLNVSGTAYVSNLIVMGVSGSAGTDPSLTVSATSPGGATTNVQYNSGGSFGGDSGLTYTSASNVLAVSGKIGVATTAPSATLDVSGSVKVGASPATCTANDYGLIRFSGGQLQICLSR